MTQNTPEACQPVSNGRLTDVGGTAVLHDHDFVRLAPALDLSAEEWLRIFRTHNGPPSSSREMFQETLKQQLERISWNIHDDDPCSESLELSRKIQEFPRILKLTILEAIERFWTREPESPLTWDERLQHLGLRPCASSHARLEALVYRRRILPG